MGAVPLESRVSDSRRCWEAAGRWSTPATAVPAEISRCESRSQFVVSGVGAAMNTASTCARFARPV
jgi:hypothetical protein